MDPKPTSDKSLQCVVVTPERTVIETPAAFVALPLYDGELGVLPGRAPLIGRLGLGELRTVHDGNTDRYYVEGGFAQVRGNVVTVLTPRAMKASDINTSAVEKSVEEACQPTGDVTHRAAQAKRVEQGRAQLRIARKTGGA